MKKILLILAVLMMLTGCSKSKDVVGNTAADRYFDMVEVLSNNEQFDNDSNYFDVSCEMSKINDGYRYYVFMDNPRIAMYNIRMVAIEEGTDYSETMASNIGVFEDDVYNMIPNQTNISKGYVKGLSVSGISDKSDTVLRIMVTWQDKQLIETYREFFRIEVSYGGQ